MEPLILTDAEISELLEIRKKVLNPGAKWKRQGASTQRNFSLESECGKKFHLYLRQNNKMEDSFSCGLRYSHPSGKEVTLCRYNGSDHPHENPLEGHDKVDNVCHIHRATERYMRAGRKPEHYAECTDRYSDLDGAFLALCLDCAVEMPSKPDPLDDVHEDMWNHEH